MDGLEAGTTLPDSKGKAGEVREGVVTGGTTRTVKVVRRIGITWRRMARRGATHMAQPRERLQHL